MAKKQLGLPPSGPTDTATVEWTRLQFDTWVQEPTVGTVITISPALVIDTDLYDAIDVTAQGSDLFISAVGAPHDHKKFMLRITDDGSSRNLSWDSVFVDSGVAKLPLITVAGRTHHVGLIYDIHASRWICLACDPVGYTVG